LHVNPKDKFCQAEEALSEDMVCLEIYYIGTAFQNILGYVLLIK